MRYSWATNPFAPRSRLPAAKAQLNTWCAPCVNGVRSFVPRLLQSYFPFILLLSGEGTRTTYQTSSEIVACSRVFIIYWTVGRLASAGKKVSISWRAVDKGPCSLLMACQQTFRLIPPSPVRHTRWWPAAQQEMQKRNNNNNNANWDITTTAALFDVAECLACPCPVPHLR